MKIHGFGIPLKDSSWVLAPQLSSPAIYLAFATALFVYNESQGQLIWMHCIFPSHEVCMAGQRTSLDRFLYPSQKAFSAFPVCDLRPSDLFLGTAFLWNHISCHYLLPIVVDSRLCTFLTVCIGLRFSRPYQDTWS